MEEFKKIRQELNQSQKKQNEIRNSVFLKEEQLKKLLNERKNLEKTGTSSEISQFISGLNSRIEKLELSIQKDREFLLKDLDQVRAFERFTDPVENLSRLDDRNPILLFPLRLETRFKKTADEKDQLWVRIFPDTIAIDSFEENMSENEIQALRIYWHRIWQAAEDETEERAAWRQLAGSFGPGRARYLTEEFFPENQNEKPSSENKTRLILTIGIEKTTEISLREAISDFWRSRWQAGNSEEKQKEAREELKTKLSMSEEEVSQIITDLKPHNFDSFFEKENTQQEIDIYFIEFPSPDDVQLRQNSWSRAAVTSVLPERLVLTGYQIDTDTKEEKIVFQKTGNPIPPELHVGPDPSLSPEEQLRQLEEGIHVNENLKWLFDFEEAIAVGMGFKIDLTPEEAARGFDKIIVLGVKISATEERNLELLEGLFSHHQNNLSGLSILSQGTPTNNTEEEASDFTEFEDPDRSFDYLQNGKQYETTENWNEKKDGQWLAEWLGLQPDFFQKTSGAGNTDQLEAKAMNKILFPATLGYSMGNMMSEVFDEQTIRHTRFYFNNYVNARGIIPSIKVGNQPYGILPAVNFQKSDWIDIKYLSALSKTTIPWNGRLVRYVSQLHSLIKKIDKDWDFLVKNTASVGKKDEPGTNKAQLLLDILGLAPNSLEHHQRYAESVESVKLRMMMWGFIFEAFSLTQSNNELRLLLNKLGYHGNNDPEIMSKIFMRHQNKLIDNLIDDEDLSEIKSIRSYTPDNKNYLEWLLEAAHSSHDKLRKQQGFTDKKVPNALLYLIIHRALDLEYIEAGMELLYQHQLIDDQIRSQFRKDPKFIHIAGLKETESRWKYLYRPQPQVTGNEEILGNYIPKTLKNDLADSYLNQQLQALEKIKNLPTARLERLLVEHIDLCTYRLDAWKQSFMTLQLAFMRNHKDILFPEFNPEDQDDLQDTTYIGAYGWLENVRSKNKVRTPVHLDDPDLAVFNPDLETDTRNEGFIAAPSLNHAVTAAVLRNAYMNSGNPDTFRVNLSSERVRKALSIIEGIRGGQNLSALLGYYFERGLHDQNHTLISINYYLYQIRKSFPLQADKIKSTQTTESDPIEAVEANNVLDGLALINHIQKTGKKEFPFGVARLKNLDPPPSDEIKKAIDKQADAIADLHDAVSDLALAEGIHQAVLGNYDKSAAVMESFSKGDFPPVPEIIQTPRSGVTITQRFGLQFKSSGWIPGNTPRSKAEPAINDWLASVLPDPDHVCVQAKITEYQKPPKKISVSQRDLKLEPIDLLFVMNTEDEQTMKDLDDRLERFIFKKYNLRPDAEIKILYTERIDNKINFFQLNALLSSLRSLILESRPLEPEDLLHNHSDSDTGKTYLNSSVIELAVNELGTIQNEIRNFKTDLSGKISDLPLHKDQLITDFDDLLFSFTEILENLAGFGLPLSSTGFLFEMQQALYKTLISKLENIIHSFTQQLLDFEEKMEAYNLLPAGTPDEDRLHLLHQLENTILTGLIDPRPENPADFKNALMTAKNELISLSENLKTIVTGSTSTGGLLQAILSNRDAALKFYFEEVRVADQEEAMLGFLEEIEEKSETIDDVLEEKIKKATGFLLDAGGLASGKEKTERIQQAAKQLFGDDFKVIPQFEVPEKTGAMWLKSYHNTNQLLSYLKNDLHRDFPVDEWVYSLARVKEKVRDWENSIQLIEIFDETRPAPELRPVQFPHQNQDFWLAAEYPEDHQVSEDTLLYTAAYSEEFDPGKKQCGLLLEEWTELIPFPETEIGVAFHYDKPDSEPPQVILLALPSSFRKSWDWNDLLGIVKETLQEAKKRTIDPDLIDSTQYARLLPATVASVQSFPVSPGLNYAAANGLFNFLNPEHNE